MRRVPAIALLTAAALGWCPATAGAAASPWSEHPSVAVRLIAAGAGPGAPLRLGLHFRLAPAWHVYWKHPGDAGSAPEVSVLLAGKDRVLASRLAFPAPHRFLLPGGLEALGYEGEVVYPLRVDPAGAGDLQGLTAAVDYVACAVECIPYHDELTLPAAAGGAGAGPTTPEETLLASWEARVPRPLEEVAGLAARLVYHAGREPRLALELVGPPLAGAEPELFLEPPPGATFGRPVLTLDGESASFDVPVSPERVGEPPPRLRVPWTVTGLAGAGGTVAVTGLADVPAGREVSAGGALESGAGGETAGGAGGAAGLLRAALAGALLALNPAGLTLLVLLARRPAAPPRRWPMPVVASLGMATSLAALYGAARLSGIAAPLAEPRTLALLALPTLGLALLLWVAPVLAAKISPVGGVLLAAPVALSWLPLAGWSAAPPVLAAAALGLGFALPFVAAGLAAGRLPAPSPFLLRTLGFVAAAGLVWSAYRLAPLLRADRLAALQLSWLLVALAVRTAAGASGARRVAWSIAAAAAAAAGVWLAG